MKPSAGWLVAASLVAGCSFAPVTQRADRDGIELYFKGAWSQGENYRNAQQAAQAHCATHGLDAVFLETFKNPGEFFLRYRFKCS